MTEVVIASNNKNKINEIGRILKGPGIKILSLDEVGFHAEIQETGETLKENALIKARAVRKKIRSKIIMADDTGLEVDYLAKAPGVYSARFAGGQCSYRDNNIKLLKLMKGVKPAQRGADFRTCVAVIFPDGKEEVFEGRVKGSIAVKPKGVSGFGYDPVFYFKEKKMTYAQMDINEKNSVSHRMKAVKKAWRAVKKRICL